MEENFIYLKLSYSYRKLQVLLTGLGLSITLLALFVWAIIPQLFGVFSQENFGVLELLVALLFLVLIPGMLLIAGISLLYVWFARQSMTLKITHEGIHYGKKFYPWARVSALWVSTQSNKTMVSFHSNRFFSTTKELYPDETLEAKQLEKFAQQIQEQVQLEHPHLRFFPSRASQS